MEPEARSNEAWGLEEKVTFLEREVEHLREELGEAFAAISGLSKRIDRLERAGALARAEEEEEEDVESSA
jgi:uncharacterized protein YhaN